MSRLSYTCTRCGEDKPATQFYTRANGARSTWCKACYVTATVEMRRRHPERRRAQRAVAAALKAGTLARPSECEECGKRRPLVAHHEDYRKPLKVKWLCHFCRTRAHVTLGRRAPRAVAS